MKRLLENFCDLAIAMRVRTRKGAGAAAPTFWSAATNRRFSPRRPVASSQGADTSEHFKISRRFGRFRENSHLLFLLAVLLAPSSVFALPPAGYYLVWDDEFNSPVLDSSKWDYWLLGNRRDAVNVTNAVTLNGSNLVITTYTSGGVNYTAMIATDGKFRSRYGYWEASIKWSDTNGEWSAFWMQSPTMGAWLYDPWSSGSEIDIAEHRYVDGSGNNIANQIQNNIHWNGYGSAARSAGSGNIGSGLAGGFHTYGFLWTPTDYTIFIDGVNVRNWNYANNGVPVSRSTEWAILSSEVDDTSTTWAGTIPSGGYGSLATSPVRLTVDYVRYYAPTNTIFWTGAVSSDLANAGNYVSNRPPLPTSDVTFSLLSGNNLFPAVNANLTLDGLIFSWMNNGLTLGGLGTLTLGAGGMDMVAANHTVNISCPVNLGADQTWAVGLNNPGNTLNVNGPVSGSATLTKSGWGTLVLNGANSFSGTLNVDTGSTGSGSQNLSDGIVRLTRSANVANVPLIAIRNNNAASSTLQLTNAIGDLVIAAAIALNGRNTNVVAIENLGGSNTLAGGLTVNVGGGYYLLQSDAGTLNLGGVISSAASGTRTITLQGNGDFYVSGSIQNGSASAIVLLKTNAGTLTITGACPFSGATTNYRGNLIVNGSLGSSLTVAGGTLAGNGAIGGATLIQAGAMLAPGSGQTAGRGTLTFGNSLTLANGSSSFFEINASAQTNDSVVAASAVIYGGTLTVTNLGGSLTAGQRFKLFNAGSLGGSFSALHLPSLGTNLVWNTAALTNGELVVARGAVAPRVGQVSLTGTNLVFGGSGGAADDNYSVLASPDVAAPLTNWSVIGTGTFDVNGNFIFTNPIDLPSGGVVRRFYRLLIP